MEYIADCKSTRNYDAVPVTLAISAGVVFPTQGCNPFDQREMLHFFHPLTVGYGGIAAHTLLVTHASVHNQRQNQISQYKSNRCRGFDAWCTCIPRIANTSNAPWSPILLRACRYQASTPQTDVSPTPLPPPLPPKHRLCFIELPVTAQFLALGEREAESCCHGLAGLDPHLRFRCLARPFRRCLHFFLRRLERCLNLYQVHGNRRIRAITRETAELG